MNPPESSGPIEPGPASDPGPADAPADVQPQINQPGLCELREAVANRRPALRRDGLAGLNTAIGSVPDGMANAILAGVNPLYGLYACMVGPLVGGAFSSTQLMVITTTSAAALAAGEALTSLSPQERDSSLFLMVLLMGALQILFGALRLGRLMRFVSYSVMSGFLMGIGVLIVLNQLPTITGYASAGDNALVRTFHILANPGQTNPATLGVSLVTLALALTLPRTHLGHLGRLVAIAIPSALVAIFHVAGVAIVQDVGEIRRGLPDLFVPSFSDITLDMLTAAPAIAAIILVQGAGVGQSVPNPDGSRSRTSLNFIAQGAANIASGFVRGLPVGGSLSSTGLNVISGAGSRWAAIFAGLWMAVIVMIFPGLVSHIAMPSLGVLLIIVGASTIKPSEVLTIWNTGWSARLVLLTTFLSTLLLSIPAAVGIGVVLSALLYLNASSTDICLVQLVERPDGRIEEHRPPRQLPANSVTVLDVYGHLFYAGAVTLERLLPEPERDAQNPVVILRLRGRSALGATLLEVLSSYADKLHAVNGRLYLTGIGRRVHGEVIRARKLQLSGPVRAYEVTPIIGESTRRALADAQAWLVGQRAQAESGDARELQ